MSIYYINIGRARRNTAGSKAPRDIASLCAQMGIREFSMPRLPAGLPRPLQKLWLLTVCPLCWLLLWFRIKKGDTLLYQHPVYGNRVALHGIPALQKKGCRCVALIHDLESLRRGISGVIRENARTNELADNHLLRYFDLIICHNRHMQRYLESIGFPGERLICLELFDYLTEEPLPLREKGKRPSIAIAGNLAPGKCRYLYDITAEGRNPNLTVHLFGINFDPAQATAQMPWHGSFTPEELPGRLLGDFGLVWDGSSAATCAGNTGEYLRYNNPHKTSLYLAAGMPVIVWREAAIADLVLAQGVGLVVDDLLQLDEAVSAVSSEAYAAMAERARSLGRRLREGAYFRAAFEKALKLLSD